LIKCGIPETGKLDSKVGKGISKPKCQSSHNDSAIQSEKFLHCQEIELRVDGDRPWFVPTTKLIYLAALLMFDYSLPVRCTCNIVKPLFLFNSSSVVLI